MRDQLVLIVARGTPLWSSIVRWAGAASNIDRNIIDALRVSIRYKQILPSGPVNDWQELLSAALSSEDEYVPYRAHDCRSFAFETLTETAPSPRNAFGSTGCRMQDRFSTGCASRVDSRLDLG